MRLLVILLLCLPLNAFAESITYNLEFTAIQGIAPISGSFIWDEETQTMLGPVISRNMPSGVQTFSIGLVSPILPFPPMPCSGGSIYSDPIKFAILTGACGPVMWRAGNTGSDEYFQMTASGTPVYFFKRFPQMFPLTFGNGSVVATIATPVPESSPLVLLSIGLSVYRTLIRKRLTPPPEGVSGLLSGLLALKG